MRVRKEFSLKKISLLALLVLVGFISSANAITFPWGQPGNCKISTPTIYSSNGNPSAASKITCSVRPHKVYFNVCLDTRVNRRWVSAGCTSTTRIRPARSSYTATCVKRANNSSTWRAKAVLIMVDREDGNVGQQKFSAGKVFKCA